MHKICSFVYFATIPILTETGATAGATTAADQDDSRSILPATPSQDYQSRLPATVTTAPPYLDGAIFRQTTTATISENPSGRSGAPCQRYLQESHELHCQRVLPADRNHHRITALPCQHQERLQSRLQGRHSPTEAPHYQTPIQAPQRATQSHRTGYTDSGYIIAQEPPTKPTEPR